MSLFQAKMKGVDMPIWMVSTDGSGFELSLGHYKRCYEGGTLKKETWNDFVIKVIYSKEKVKGTVDANHHISWYGWLNYLPASRIFSR